MLVERQMLQEPIKPFRRTPRSSEQAIHVGAKHRKRVVHRKKGIVDKLLQLPLARGAALRSLVLDVLNLETGF